MASLVMGNHSEQMLRCCIVVNYFASTVSLITALAEMALAAETWDRQVMDLFQVVTCGTHDEVF